MDSTRRDKLSSYHNTTLLPSDSLLASASGDQAFNARTLGVYFDHTQTTAIFAPRERQNLKSLRNWEGERKQQKWERHDLRGNKMVGRRVRGSGSSSSTRPTHSANELASWKIRLRSSPELLWSIQGSTTQKLGTHQGLCHTVAFPCTHLPLCFECPKAGTDRSPAMYSCHLPLPLPTLELG